MQCPASAQASRPFSPVGSMRAIRVSMRASVVRTSAFERMAEQFVQSPQPQEGAPHAAL